MVDKIVEMDVIAAQKLAEEMEEVYLDLGITTLNEQLPYFLELMQKHRLNHNNPDHLRMVRDSLEAKLNPPGEVIKTPELALILSGQPLDMLQKFDFESYFLEECGRVKNELAEIYWEYIETKTPKFKLWLSQHDDTNYSRVIDFSGYDLTIHEADERSAIKEWDTSNCLHGLFSININKVIIGHSCVHIGGRVWMDYDKIAKLAYKYYFETTDSIDITKSFKLYFDIFRKLPEEIRKCASPSIIKKDAEEKMNQLQNARQEIIEYYLGKTKP